MQNKTKKLIKKLNLDPHNQKAIDEVLQNKEYMRTEKAKLKRIANGFAGMLHLRKIFGITK